MMTSAGEAVSRLSFRTSVTKRSTMLFMAPPSTLARGEMFVREFRIQRARLASGRLQPAVRRQVGVNRDQPLLQRDGADEVQKEGLARAVLPDYEPNSRSAV